MLEIKHTLCPSCSVGCGINVVSQDGDVVGTYSYKRHQINEGKNCLNGRNSIEIYKNKFEVSDIEKIIDEVSNELKSNDANKITVVCSGNNSVEEAEMIKNFAELNNFNIAFYADNFVNLNDDIASYDEIENASKIIVIGDVVYENPLIGRKIVHAKKNGANIYSFTPEKTVTANVSDEIADSIESLLNDKLDDDSVVVYSKIESSDDLEKIMESIANSNCKSLPVFSKCNSKGVSKIIDAKSKEDVIELLDNTDVLLIFNDDLVAEIDYDYKSISKIITFVPCSNSTSDISTIVVPIKSWLETDGSYVNAMGLFQSFENVVESENLSEIEIIETIQNKL
ncbi:MAG: molybdopterin-dependent oxidoreductase [Methanobrevibacter sp.]|nr:molybdopterin-dependent oxidoreductase [Methanobrevibacter sp.]